ncbi:cytochrome P450 [Cyathus striatus]|nr:cytochrome P450 [Cyathus striatus]
MSLISTDSPFLLPVATLAVVLLAGVAYSRSDSQKGTKLPPGPPQYPFIGNLLALVKAERPHLLFRGWSKEYGPIVRFNILGFKSIVINKLHIANELLEKRGAIYSDRPNMILENELLGWGAAMPTMRYGAQFRKHRRLSQALLNPNAARSYATMHEELSRRLVKGLYEQPEKFRDHILIYATTTIFRLAYDLDITSGEHELVKLASGAIRKSAEAYQASGALVDVFPSLKWFYTSYPDSFPFSGFKTAVSDLKEMVIKANGIPFEMAKEKIVYGSAQRCVVNDAITTCGGLENLSKEDEEDIRGLAGILYGAGQDTTMATLNTLILAMLHFPAAQRAAQAEIDRVIPKDRLADLDDRHNLPYMEKFLNELYRWASPLEISIPHAVIQDDVYDGYFIPKGTSVIASIYDMLNECPRPTEFLPERFDKDVPADPRDVVFGFGRRRCPGLHVADNSVWTATIRLLSCFEFLPEIAKDGKEVLPPLDWGKEMTRHPEPFKCRIVPRKGRKSFE